MGLIIGCMMLPFEFIYETSNYFLPKNHFNFKFLPIVLFLVKESILFYIIKQFKFIAYLLYYPTNYWKRVLYNFSIHWLLSKLYDYFFNRMFMNKEKKKRKKGMKKKKIFF